MDFLSRDRLRQAVEQIARSGGRRSGARRGAGGRGRARVRAALVAADRTAHVGYPPDRSRARRLRGARARAAADGPAARSARPAAGRAALSRRDRRVHRLARRRRRDATRGRRRLGRRRRPSSRRCCSSMPMSDVAVGLVQRLALWIVAAAAPAAPRLPRRRAGRRAHDGHHSDAADVGRARRRRCIEHLEVLALANLDPNIHFAILSDFEDAATRERPDDAAILDGRARRPRRARARASARITRAVLSLPSRPALESERAGLDGLGTQARQDRGIQRAAARRDRHGLRRADRRARRAAVACRYCLTLDRDTFLPRDAAKKLIGIIAHPLNRPRVDPAAGRVVEGYGILQPRVSVTMASALGSTFARTYAGHTGVDPYTTAVSDVYQDIFDEGIFTGKGLYDVDAFRAVARRARAGEHAALARSVRRALRADRARLRRRGRRRLPVERARARAPAASVGARRLADPAVAVPGRPHAAGLERNRLPAISRWKIVDNLRRSLVGPATVALFVAGWMALPGQPWVWTLAAPRRRRLSALPAPRRSARRAGAGAALVGVLADGRREPPHRGDPVRRCI